MNTADLDSLVARYGQTDAQIKALKKANDIDKEQLTTTLAKMGENKWTAGGFTVQRVESNRETLNEEKLLALMQLHKEMAELHGILKIKAYVDMDALESAIYTGKIPQDVLQELDQCRETKVVVSLRCSKAKEK